MPIKPMKSPFKRKQSGASLIEVLVAILLLSFGMLSLGAMLSYSVQLPKLAAYRATASNLASSHIEKIRANPTADYAAVLSYDGTFGIPDVSASLCTYPACTSATLATMDTADTQQAVRMSLPAGGLMVTCATAPCQAGELWMVWQEPSTFAALNPSNADNCPIEVTGTYTTPKPRCLYVRFGI